MCGATGVLGSGGRHDGWAADAAFQELLSRSNYLTHRDGMLAHLTSLALKKLMPGNMSRLKIVNGDTVTVSYGDVRASFTAYANPIFQDAARVEASLRQLEVGFNAGLANADADGARGLGMKSRMIKNALRIMDDELTIQDGVHNPYEAYSVGAAYLMMLTDSAASKPPAPGTRPSGPWDPLLPSSRAGRNSDLRRIQMRRNATQAAPR